MSPILGIYASQISGKLATTSFESIQTITVGSGGASSISFTSIPSTYSHLQIRCFNRLVTDSSIAITTNSGTFVRRHYFYGDGATALTGADATNAGVWSVANANIFSINIIDFLDYTNTNKNCTVRNLGGSDINASGGALGIITGLFTSSSAINSITLTPAGTNFAQYSSFALYGIK